MVGKSRQWRNGGNGGPRVLFYGHYDVQPVDPLDLWETPPFEPRIATTPDGRKIIVARGACDDKGQVMTFVEALPRLQGGDRRAAAPITMMIEGEEECGSSHLFDFVKDNAARAQAATSRSSATPACGTRRRRRSPPRCAASSTRRCKSPARTATCIPACSAARRRIRSACWRASSRAMHDKNGRVTIPGFYDGVKELPADIKADLKRLKLTPKDFLGEVGLKVPAGEKDRMLIEQISTRPTAEINGIIGGYTGEGAKTVIPGQATAKVSFRLVGAQNPKKIRDAFRDFVRERLPADAKVEFANFGLAPADPAVRSTIRRSSRRAPRSPTNGAARR